MILELPLTMLGVASPAVVEATAVAVAYILVSFLHIVIGEVVPKSIAIRRPEASGLWIAVPLRICHFVFFVPLWILNVSSNGILRLVGLGATVHEPAHTEDEIRIILARSHSGGELSSLRLLQSEFVAERLREASDPQSLLEIIRAADPAVVGKRMPGYLPEQSGEGIQTDINHRSIPKEAKP
ncbi:MAG: DUF21 domain-containing protein [Verrucomicrobia bacterium]|nr:DUF21 domain-containing protein [Verrucomicrobiota bacterium]